MSTFTPEQNNAIDSAGSFVLVSAAAGSGKTTVIIEKLTRMLSETDEDKRISADRLIVVTFTNDAANQLKRKLGKALADAAAACSKEESGKKHWLMTQQTLLGAAKISTINSFCFNLIRNNAEALGIPADFRILSEEESSTLLIRSIEDTCAKWFDNGRKDDMELIGQYFSNEYTDKHSRYDELIRFRSFIMSIPFSDERFFAPILSEYSRAEMDDFSKESTSVFSERFYLLKKAAASGEIKALCENLMNELFTDDIRAAVEGQKDSKSKANALDVLDTDTSVFNTLAAGQSLSDDIILTLGTLSFKPTKTNLKYIYEKYLSDKDAAEETAERIGSCAKKLTKLFSALGEIRIPSEEEIRSDYLDHAVKVRLFNSFIKDINLRFTELKSEKNGLVFEDGEQLALKLLGRLSESTSPDGSVSFKVEKTTLAQSLSEDNSIIIIDEFQDSNNIQDMIFRLLSPSGDSEHEGRNMFIVGDIKQSIYNFRLANPDLFRSYLSGSELYNKDCPTNDPRHILLNCNFRSSRSVIGFVNAIFGAVMTYDFGGIDYDDTQKLKYSEEVWEKGNAEKSADIGDLTTEIMLVDKSGTPMLTSPPPEPSEEDGSETDAPEMEPEIADLCAARTEAVCAALKVHKLISESGGKIAPRDICILCPSNKETVIFAEAVTALGIKASVENHSKYLESREITIIINFLKAIDDPHRSIALAGLLMSPIFMFSAEDMAVLNLTRGKNSYYTSAAHIASGKSDEKLAAHLSAEKSAALKARCAHFMEIFSEIRRTAACMGIEDTIRTIYSMTEIIPMMSLYPNGATRAANLKLLPEYAHRYESGNMCGLGGIYGFVNYVDSILPNKKIDFESASAFSEADNAVAVKTIHKSKGLEYPIVFLTRTIKKAALDNSRIYYNIDNMLAFDITDSDARMTYRSYTAEQISRRNTAEQTSELLRLMYVAMTRAKHKLIITGITDMSVTPVSGEHITAFYRPNAVFPVKKAGCPDYSSFECDVTDCEPDYAITKILRSFGEPVAERTSEGVSVNTYALSSKKNMMGWILSALYAAGSVRYVSDDGTVFSGSTADIIPGSSPKRIIEPPSVRIKACRADMKLYEQIVKGETGEAEESADDTAAKADVFRQELLKYRRYDTDDSFSADRISSVTPAKLTVTAITRMAHSGRDDELSGRFIPAENKLTLEKSSVLSAADRGTAIHTFMQYADLHEIERAIKNGEDDPVGTEAERLYLEDMLDCPAKDMIAGDETFKRRLAGYLSSPLWTELISKAAPEAIFREQPFMAKLGDIYDENSCAPLDSALREEFGEKDIANYADTFIQGIADFFVLTSDGSFVLIDYKTNRGMNAETLIKTYRVQLMLYTRVFEDILGAERGSGKAYICSFGIDDGYMIEIM